MSEQADQPKQGGQAAQPKAGDGLVIIDKPQEWTSHDVVGRMRRIAQTRKVGHAGTLDPMATGILVLGINRATKLLGHLTLATKTYIATIRLGQATNTDDAEGEITASADAAVVDAVTDAQIAEQVAALTGDIQQVPSSVSAIKVDGKRAYALVRSGEEVKLKARPAMVSVFDVHAIRRDEGVIDVDVTVTVSSGTYVRALARDLGAALGIGGHLTALRRTHVGPFGLEHAQTLEQAAEALVMVPLAQACRDAFAARELTEDEARDIGFGRALSATGVDGVVGVFFEGRCLALVEDKGDKAKPHVVFEPA